MSARLQVKLSAACLADVRRAIGEVSKQEAERSVAEWLGALLGEQGGERDHGGQQRGRHGDRDLGHDHDFGRDPVHGLQRRDLRREPQPEQRRDQLRGERLGQLVQRDAGGVTMAHLYFLRHQVAGILHEQAYAAVPSGEEMEAAVLRLVAAHGARHPKTGLPYWTKLVEVDMDLPAGHPARVRTVGGVVLEVNDELPADHPDHVVARLVDGCDVDALASGYCPIREGELVPDRGEGMAIGPGNVGTIEIVASGTGRVE